MQKNKISLVGTTQGDREFEVDRLFNSLVGTKDFLEVVFVDQSEASEIENIVNKYKDTVTIKLIKSEKKSLSKARNLALREVSGNIIGFCDDDAFYDKEFFEFIKDKDYENPFIASFPITDISTMKNYGGRSFPKIKKKTNYLDIIKYSSSIGTFLFLNIKEKHFFNEKLGAGAKYGGSEETELFFRLKSIGYESYFTPNKGIYHDNDVISSSEMLALSMKYKLYAQGYAVVIKKYMYSSKGFLLIEVINTIFRCFAGIVIKQKSRSLYVNRLKGFLKGLLFLKL